ncbi:MAG: hypothetical protein Kapaf2KO_19570 [Candidatus Kapaibacteriales bacterium]
MTQVAVLQGGSEKLWSKIAALAKTEDITIKFIDSDVYEDFILSKLIDKTEKDELYDISVIQDIIDNAYST